MKNKAFAALVVATTLILTGSVEAKVLVLHNGCAFVGEDLEPKENCTIEIRDGKNPAEIRSRCDHHIVARPG